MQENAIRYFVIAQAELSELPLSPAIPPSSVTTVAVQPELRLLIIREPPYSVTAKVVQPVQRVNDETQPPLTATTSETQTRERGFFFSCAVPGNGDSAL